MEAENARIDSVIGTKHMKTEWGIVVLLVCIDSIWEFLYPRGELLVYSVYIILLPLSIMESQQLSENSRDSHVSTSENNHLTTVFECWSENKN